MKLPTLNVDVAVNTKTMQKGIAEANKKIAGLSKQGLSIAGGAIGAPSFGAIGAISGAVGAAGFTGLAGSLTALALPMAGLALYISSANKALETLASSTGRGAAALDAMAEGKPYGGIDLGAAGRLAMAAPAAELQATSAKGIFDTFIASTMNAQGEMEGVFGLISDWARYTSEGFKAAVAATGAFYSGQSFAEIERRADQATTRSAGGAQAYMTTTEINQQADFVAFERNRKAQREQNT